MRRVVVTGIGAVSPCGLDTASTWGAIVEGKSGIGPITRFDATRLRHEDRGRVHAASTPRSTSRRSACARATASSTWRWRASVQAVEDSGLRARTTSSRSAPAPSSASACAASALIEEQHDVLREKGPRRMTPYFIPGAIANLAPGQVSIRYGLKGPSYTTTSACSSGAHAIGEALRWIQRGDMDAAVAGGAEVGDHAARRRRLQRHARAVQAQRRAAEGEPSVRQATATAS